MTLKALTLNLWNDEAPWPQRARALRQWLDRLDPDLVGLQEVLRVGEYDQLADLLEERLPFRAFAAGERIRRGARDGDLGNALASRWPIVASESQSLPDRGDGETRVALHADVASPYGRLALCVTHLHWSFDHGDTRCEQVRVLAERLLARHAAGEFPPLLLADLNAEPDSDEVRYLTGGHALGGRTIHLHDAWRVAGDGGPGHTWSNRNPYARPNFEPDRRIDYVFAGAPKIDGVGWIERCRVVCDGGADGAWPSDHSGVFAELRTEPAPWGRKS